MASHNFSRLLVVLLPLPILIIFWELLSRSGIFNIHLFPPPSACLRALIASAMSGELLRDAWYSVQRIVVGYSLGVTIGLIAGICTGRSAIVNATLGQIFHILRPLPPVAMVPLAVLWFGLGEASKYFLIAWGSFFPLWINSHLGISAVDQKYIWAAKSLGASKRSILQEIILPGALPLIIAGMRTSIAIAFICVFVGEMAGAYEGIGFRISMAHLVFRADKMISLLVILGILGAIADWGFTRLVCKLFPWYSLTRQ